MIGLSDYLRHLAAWVWNEQGEARHYGLKLQEETITEMLLLRMARECQDRGLHVKMFNRIEEGGSRKSGKTGNGADWEWFIDTGYCQVGFLVQAKVLSSDITAKHGLSLGKYKGLAANNQQTKNLIEHARNRNINPIYIFYNHSWIRDRALFSSNRHLFPAGPRDWGCSVSTAQFVQSRRKNSLSTLIDGMMPWHHFFGFDQGCITRSAMAKLQGDQEFISQSPRPEWLEFMHHDIHAMGNYLKQRNLSGVAYFHFKDIREE